MEPVLTYAQAVSMLQSTGSVRMPGKPALWSGAMRWLFLALIVLVLIVLVVVGPIGIIAALVSDVSVTPATIFGIIACYAMLAGVLALLFTLYRRQGRYKQIEHSVVRLEPQGLTLRGVGPIPWRDFNPAQSTLVPAEHDSGYVLRAVMPLSPSGFANVNQRLPPNLRGRLCPASGPIWNKAHRYIYVPGVEGLSQGEVTDLLNRAHSMYSRPVPTAPQR
ncbi:hypothetical protein [Microbacterium sp. MPKO10]|uniref:hypothetical protein n=1 Tax=Microbacterium sp. MPKO10 TaxID=2989818 RepID=UPI0022354F35|nr:hypothetical protein [Microbacterium sp. MPKO10]MCW4458025.1 hypothetical protein [Microbacterium sp. MPKO10]